MLFLFDTLSLYPMSSTGTATLSQQTNEWSLQNKSLTCNLIQSACSLLSLYPYNSRSCIYCCCCISCVSLFCSQHYIVSEPKYQGEKTGTGERGVGGYEEQLVTCRLTCMKKTEASFFSISSH